MPKTKDLFSEQDFPVTETTRNKPDSNVPPLAEALRPSSIDEVIGQMHLLGPGRPLRIAFESGKLHSLILWGPPGVGKTTLARLMAKAFKAHFISLSAVFSGVKDIREAVSEAEMLQKHNHQSTILFVDEVHRFNKAQQDAFLPYVEAGTITFIGATTENPSFEVNSALLSRATVYVLEPLKPEELILLFKRAQTTTLNDLYFEEAVVAQIIGLADGDARRLLNLLEQLANAARAKKLTKIDPPFTENTLAQNLRRFDKRGEIFYDQISALHKSLRGSNPDAALYWFCRMLDGGADPRYIARRLIRFTWEDIGLADPRAAQLTLDAAETYERLGSPEGELALANAVLYLACAAKSNAAYCAFGAAKAFVKQDESRSVPLHLRNASTHLMKELGYGKDYRYAHDETEAYAASENYWPENMPPVSWYQPSERGLEARIAEKLAHLRQLDQQATKKP